MLKLLHAWGTITQITQAEEQLAARLDTVPGLRAEADQEAARAVLLEREIGAL